MKLSEYLEIGGNTATGLAEKLGVSVSSVTRAAKGEMRPSAAFMQAVFNHTGGLVSPNDFFALDAIERERAAQ
jgi:transcriptional regulator with XRE-family HTH domain